MSNNFNFGVSEIKGVYSDRADEYILIELPVADNVTVPLSRNHNNIFRFTTPLNQEVNLFVTGLDKLILGDTFTLSLKIDDQAFLAEIHLSDDFYLVQAGNANNDITLTSHSRWVVSFFFDGEKLVSDT